MSETHLRVRVGAEQYALAVEFLREVDLIGELTPVPGAHPSVLGVRNLRGSVVPVLDLAALLRSGGRSSPSAIVVVEHGGRLAALAIDEPIDVEPLHGSPQESDAPFLRGAVLRGGALVGMLDIERLLDAVQEGVPG